MIELYVNLNDKKLIWVYTYKKFCKCLNNYDIYTFTISLNLTNKKFFFNFIII